MMKNPPPLFCLLVIVWILHCASSFALPSDLHRQLLKHSKRSKNIFSLDATSDSANALSLTRLATSRTDEQTTLSNAALPRAGGDSELLPTVVGQQGNEIRAFGVGDGSSNLVGHNLPASTRQRSARRSDSQSGFEGDGPPIKKRKLEAAEGGQIVPWIATPGSEAERTRAFGSTDNPHDSDNMEIEEMWGLDHSQFQQASSGVAKPFPKIRRWLGEGDELLDTAGSRLNKELKEYRR